MSLEKRETGPDMRLAGEKYCVDCPDPEACHQGCRCDVVRVAAENTTQSARAQYVIIDEWEGTPMANIEDHDKTEDQEPGVDYDKTEVDYDQDVEAGLKVRTWLANAQPEKILTYGVLIAFVIGLGRRKIPRRIRVDYHHYVHVVKK